ncbi:transglycosylase domain-containing protein [Psychromarinibacter halotolerans]|uniref:peptidoglycan glycosyltransferase n=1 Tax=Psychromarinibacter halotolerans TaxID=1775175 RepID=A0ABV7GIV0_9RHOB|nr:transglycosylase domain-containing protein [Psychromarinibacter halotolerans]MDF0596044.1 transglycosylase domain-containing protein [Psychromarinibacter halotolerans]
MSGNGRKTPPLVADKRTRAAAKPTKGRTPTRGKVSKRGKAKPTKRTGRRGGGGGRGGILGFFRSIFRWIFRLLFKAFAAGATVVVLIVGIATYYFYSTLPPLEDLLDGRTRGSVTMLDRYGEVFAWRGDQFGGQVTAETVAPVLKNAVVATEDKRFYRHLGVSPRGIASAIAINLREGRSPLSGHGGSTITQQVAKLLCLGVPFDRDTWETEAEYETDCRRGTLWRKIKEMPYAFALEAKYSKDEILTVYLNRTYMGGGAYGFEAASQRYFGKGAAQVNASEAAMLAGLLTAPSRYAPTSNLERSQERASVVLRLMHEQGYLTDAEFAHSSGAPAMLSAAAEARAGGYFADWVMDSGPGFLTRETTEDVVIRTTFDQRIQTAAETGLSAVFDAKVKEGSEAQAAIVIMSADGAVRAVVGGRKFTGISGQFNRAIMAKRQSGSAFKPFVYATALDLGYRFDDYVLDAPLTINVPGSGPWSPRNYTREFYGEVTLTEALARSLNTAAVRLSEAVGRDNVRHVAEDFGIVSDLAVGPALALGTSEVSLLEITGAYAGILNGGSSVKPYGLIDLRLVGDDAPLMDQSGGLGERVISEQAARQLIYMMTKVIEFGSGGRAQLPGREVAGKTGTTQANRDAWFIGFTADYVAGVWMGYDDNTPLSGVTGGGLPAEIWGEVMGRVHEGLPAQPLPMIDPTTLPPRTPPPGQVQNPPPGQPNNGNGGDTMADRIINDVLDSIFGTPNR